MSASWWIDPIFDKWGWSGEFTGSNCKHPDAVVVDEWDEVESDPYRLSDREIHCVKFECPDCYKIWVETSGEGQ